MLWEPMALIHGVFGATCLRCSQVIYLWRHSTLQPVVWCLHENAKPNQEMCFTWLNCTESWHRKLHYFWHIPEKVLSGPSTAVRYRLLYSLITHIYVIRVLRGLAHFTRWHFYRNHTFLMTTVPLIIVNLQYITE